MKCKAFKGWCSVDEVLSLKYGGSGVDQKMEGEHWETEL